MRKILRILIWTAVVSVFLGTIVFLAKKSRKKPDIYSIEMPQKLNIVKKTIATGSVVPRKEIMIKPQISGIIKEVYKEAGETVKKGEIIAKVQVIPDMISLNTATSRVKQAELNYQNEKLKYERQKKLFDKAVISESDFENAVLSFNSAVQELETAKNNLEIIKEGVSKGSENTSNTLVRSTITGMVLDVPVKEGNSVIQSNNFNDGTTIAVVADMSDMIFEGKVDETEVGKIREGMPLKLTIGAIENEYFNAILEYISPKGEEENGAIQFDIKAKVNLKENRFIRAGYSANAEMILEQHDSVMAISEGVISFSNDSSFVEILTSDSVTVPQQFEKRYITTGLSDGIHIEVISGLNWDDKIRGEIKTEDEE